MNTRNGKWCCWDQDAVDGAHRECVGIAMQVGRTHGQEEGQYICRISNQQSLFAAREQLQYWYEHFETNGINHDSAGSRNSDERLPVISPIHGSLGQTQQNTIGSRISNNMSRLSTEHTDVFRRPDQLRSGTPPPSYESLFSNNTKLTCS